MCPPSPKSEALSALMLSGSLKQLAFSLAFRSLVS